MKRHTPESMGVTERPKLFTGDVCPFCGRTTRPRQDSHERYCAYEGSVYGPDGVLVGFEFGEEEDAA